MAIFDRPGRCWRIFRSLARFVAMRFQSTRLLEVSSSLTLTTILSIVPLLAVIVAAFSVFPMFGEMRVQIENFIFSSLLPDAYQREIVAYLKEFARHAGGLTVAGIAGLAVTAWMLLNTIDKTINKIFGVTRRRSFLGRTLLYLFLILIGPSLVAVSGMLMHEVLAAGASLSGTLPVWGGVLANALIQSLAYAWIYYLIPNTYIRFRYCLAGGFFVCMTGMIAKWGFALYLARSPMSAIYGPFVAVPIGILWIYVTWTLVLGGAALASSIPMLVSGRFSDMGKAGNPFLSALAILRSLASSYGSSKPSRSLRSLCKSLDIYPQMAQDILDKLITSGIVKKEDRVFVTDRYALAVAPSSLSLKAVWDLFLIDPSISLISDGGVLRNWYAATLADLRPERTLLTSLTEVNEKDQ